MKQKVCIIGLGYVGLPLACLASKVHDVIGLDIDGKKVDLINQKMSPVSEKHTESLLQSSTLIASTDFTKINDANIIVVCVPTPIDDKQLPDLKPLIGATTSVASHMKKGQILIIESTIHPGTCEEIVIPLVESITHLKHDHDFHVVHCPERIDPGNMKWTIQNIPRVIGSKNPHASQAAHDFYTSFIDANFIILNSLKAAEATKIMENTFRDINIAFINEMAMSFDVLGIDIIEVIKGASTKPFAFMPHFPGPGVGGHCIPVDPYYLIEKAKTNGFSHRFLSLAREINNSMPDYVFKIIQNELNNINLPLKGTRIGILGYAYKKNIGDARETPAHRLIHLLHEQGSTVHIYDPFVPQESTHLSLASILNDSDLVVFVTDHDEFTQMDYTLLKNNKTKVVIDPRNVLDQEKIISLGLKHRGVGRGH